MFIHTKTGKAYTILTRDALVQIDNTWVPAVIYKSAVDSKLPTFIRDVGDFDKKFVKSDLTLKQSRR